jgi:hypothetical protein
MTYLSSWRLLTTLTELLEKSMKIQRIALPLALSALALNWAAPARSQVKDVKSATPTPMAASAPTVVPALIPFSGIAPGGEDKAAAHDAPMTFLIFTNEQGGDPLWAETQSVSIDAAGHYTIQLGASNPNGLPAGLFSSGEARWLEVQIAGEAPQPRVLLSSVPYAMKSADADSLAGHQATDFVTQAQLAGLSEKVSRVEATAAPALQPELSPSGTGTANTVPLWTSSSTLGNSIITQSSGKIGINFAAPTATFEVGGAMTVHGTLNFPPGVPATSTHSSQSQSFVFGASAWNSTTSAPVTTTYTLLASPTGNNTATPGSIFYFTYQPGDGTSTNLFTINGKGLLSLPNSAGGISAYGNISLSPLNWATASASSNSPLLEIGASSFSSKNNIPEAQTFAWQAQAAGNDTTAPTGSLALLFGENGATPSATGFSIGRNGQITFAPGQTFPGGSGTGTITGITTSSPLTGGGTAGSVALGLNTAALETTLNGQYAQLAAANTFTQPITFASGQTFPGTLSSVTAASPLTVTNLNGRANLSLDTSALETSLSSVYPTLAGNNTFTGSTQFQGGGLSAVASGAGSSAFYGHGVSGAIGVYGDSEFSYGVYGITNTGYGVYGEAIDDGNAGYFSNDSVGHSTLYATNTAATSGGQYPNAITGLTSGSGTIAITGNTAGTNSTSVYGYATGVGSTGVDGYSGATSSSTTGAQGVGVSGNAAQGIGVLGTEGSGTSSVYANQYSEGALAGVWGDIAGGRGAAIMGTADDAYAGAFTSTSSLTTLYASNQGTGYAGYFINGSTTSPTLYVFNTSSGGTGAAAPALMAGGKSGTCGIGNGGDLSCTGQLKSLNTAGGGARKVETYAMQSPENWMEDFGSGELERGVAVIRIDSAFAETVTADASYHVFITPNGDSKGLYVIRKTATTFEVRESGGGVSSLSFDYRIVAKRRGYEAQRLTDVTDHFNLASEIAAAGTATGANNAVVGGSTPRRTVIVPNAQQAPGQPKPGVHRAAIPTQP